MRTRLIFGALSLILISAAVGWAWKVRVPSSPSELSYSTPPSEERSADFAIAEMREQEWKGLEENLLSDLQFLTQAMMDGRDLEFEAALASALAKHEKHPAVLSLAGDFYYLNESYDKALEMVQSLLGQEPHNKAARLFEAEVLSVLGQRELATERQERLFREYPEDPQVVAQYWSIHYAAGRGEQARSRLYEEWQRQPTNTSLIETLWRTERDPGEKRALVEEALAVQSSHPKLLHLDALNRFFEGDYSGSRAQIDRLLRQSVEESMKVQAQDLLIQSYMMERRWDEALQEIERLRREQPQMTQLLNERQADIEKLR